MGATLKDASVDLAGLDAGGQWLKAVLDAQSDALVSAGTLQAPLVITCGCEGHGPTDPHTLGHALDVRTDDLTPAQIRAVYVALVEALGRQFTVLWEVAPGATVPPELADLAYVGPVTAPHLHLQVRKGHTFDPAQP